MTSTGLIPLCQYLLVILIWSIYAIINFQMNLCPNCAAEIIPGSKFCNRCGDKIAERTKECPACAHRGPLTSVFCHHCGFHFEGERPSEAQKYQPVFPLDFDSSGTLTEQVKSLFFRNLRQRVEEEHKGMVNWIQLFGLLFKCSSQPDKPENQLSSHSPRHWPPHPPVLLANDRPNQQPWRNAKSLPHFGEKRKKP